MMRTILLLAVVAVLLAVILGLAPVNEPEACAVYNPREVTTNFNARIYEVSVRCRGGDVRTYTLGSDEQIRGDWVDAWQIGKSVVLLTTDAFAVFDLATGERRHRVFITPPPAPDPGRRRIVFGQRHLRFTPLEASSSIVHVFDLETGVDAIVYPDEKRLTPDRWGDKPLFWTKEGEGELVRDIAWSPDGRWFLGLWSKGRGPKGRSDMGFLLGRCDSRKCTASVVRDESIDPEAVTGIKSLEWEIDKAHVRLEDAPRGRETVRTVELGNNE